MRNPIYRKIDSFKKIENVREHKVLENTSSSRVSQKSEMCSKPWSTQHVASIGPKKANGVKKVSISGGFELPQETSFLLVNLLSKIWKKRKSLLDAP